MKKLIKFIVEFGSEKTEVTGEISKKEYKTLKYSIDDVQEKIIKSSEKAVVKNKK
jgi:hypothetical protein